MSSFLSSNVPPLLLFFALGHPSSAYPQVPSQHSTWQTPVNLQTPAIPGKSAPGKHLANHLLSLLPAHLPHQLNRAGRLGFNTGSVTLKERTTVPHKPRYRTEAVGKVGSPHLKCHLEKEKAGVGKDCTSEQARWRRLVQSTLAVQSSNM